MEGEIKKNWPSNHKPAIATPENGVRVRLRFRKNVVADVLGGVATEVLKHLETSSVGSGLQTGWLALPLIALLTSIAFLIVDVVALVLL